MTKYEAAAVMSHLWALYPRSNERWPKARQDAFLNQLSPMHITVEQVKAVCDDVAMKAKSTWCPPEGEIIKRLRGLSETRNQDARVQATKPAPRDPNDKTITEWTRWFLADPRRQDHLDEQQLRGLAMLAGSRERRERSEFDTAIAGAFSPERKGSK
jgi:hypothetical protein